jgi:hypothetical protein
VNAFAPKWWFQNRNFSQRPSWRPRASIAPAPSKRRVTKCRCGTLPEPALQLESSSPKVALHSDGGQCRPAGLPIKEVDDDAQHDRPRYLIERNPANVGFRRVSSRLKTVSSRLAGCPVFVRDEAGPLTSTSTPGVDAGGRVIDSPQRWAGPSIYACGRRPAGR